MSLTDRALAAAKESEAKSKKAQRTRKRNAEQRARDGATKAFRNALELPDDVEGEVVLRDADGAGFVTEYEGFEFHIEAQSTIRRGDGGYVVCLVLGEDDERRFSSLVQLGKILDAEGLAK